MLTTNDFDFELPEHLIAQTPLLERSQSKLLVLNSRTGAYQDKHFIDLLDELNSNDVLILNNTKVLPARLHGVKQDTLGLSLIHI